MNATPTSESGTHILQRSTYSIEEHEPAWKGAYRFDVRDPDSGAPLLACGEDRLGPITRLFRLSDYRRTTPFDMIARDGEGRQVVRLVRGVPVVQSRVRVLDGENLLIGTLRQHAFSISGAFDVLDATGQLVCRIQGRATRKAFTLSTADDVELARITKRWAGMSKELLTSADHYLLTIDPVVPPDLILRQLILASALGIGLMVKLELP